MYEIPGYSRTLGVALAAAIGGGVLSGCGESASTRPSIPPLATPGRPIICEALPGGKPQAIREPAFSPSDANALSGYFHETKTTLVAKAAAYVVACRRSLTETIVSNSPVPLTVNNVPENQTDCVAWTAIYDNGKAAVNNAPTNALVAVCAPTPTTSTQSSAII